MSASRGKRTTGITPPVNLKTAQLLQQCNLDTVIQDVPKLSDDMSPTFTYSILLPPHPPSTPFLCHVLSLAHVLCLFDLPIPPPLFHKQPSITSTHLFYLGQPFFIAGQFCHKGLVLQPLPVQLLSFIPRCVSGHKHLLFHPLSQSLNQRRQKQPLSGAQCSSQPFFPPFPQDVLPTSSTQEPPALLCRGLGTCAVTTHPSPHQAHFSGKEKIKISTSAAMVAMETLKPFLRVAPGSSCPTNSWCCGPDAAVPASQSQRWQKQPAKKKKCANYNTGKE